MAGGFSVTITAVDGASKQIDAINKRLQAIRAPMERLNSSLTKFSRLSGLSDLAAGMKRLAGGAFDVFRNITRIIAPLGTITGAASLAGMYRMAGAWAVWAQHQEIAAKRIGLSSGKLQEFEGVARLAGSSTEAMDGSLQGLRDNLFNLTQGMAGADTVQAFQALGLGGNFAKDHLNDLSGALPIVLARLRAIQDPTLRAEAATKIFGSAAAGLAPVINLTSEQFDAYAKKVREHGNITADQTAKLTLLAQSEENLRQSVDGVGIAISAAVSGPLSDLLSGLSKWIDANRDLIASKVDEYAQRFASWLKGVDWTAVGSGLKDFATETGHLATELAHVIEWMDRMGLVGPALGVVLGAKLLAPLLGITKALGLIGAFSPPGWVLAAMGIGGAAAGAMNVPMVDDQGRLIPDENGRPQNWGGADGQRKAAGYPTMGHDNTPAQPFVPLGTKLWNWLTGSSEKKQGIAAIYPGQGTQGGGDARNLRNNNPTNLEFHGQPGGVSDGRFAKFPNMETGVAADLNQFLRYQENWKGFNGTGHRTSIEDMIHTATPASDNNPGVETYIDRVAAAMGMKRTDSPNLRDPDVARRYILAISPNEGGTPNADAVQRGVNLRLGIPTPPSPSGAPVAAPTANGPPAVIASAPSGAGGSDTPPPSGSATITVRHVNPPPGATVTAQTTGNIFNGAPRIETSLPGVGGGAE